MKEIDLVQGVVNIFLNIPLFVIIGYFIHRANNKRDEFEKETSEQLHKIDIRTALIEKEAEFNKILYKNVIEIHEKVNKQEKDINTYYERLRQIESRTKPL